MSKPGTSFPFQGSVPSDTVIMFAIGGYSYSLSPNPWTWLTSKQAAEEMAVNVAGWPEKYGCDGIDLDLEEGAGARREAGPNMIHFIRKIREIRKAAGLPRMIISQPTYGYPQVQLHVHCTYVCTAFIFCSRFKLRSTSSMPPGTRRDQAVIWLTLLV